MDRITRFVGLDTSKDSIAGVGRTLENAPEKVRRLMGKLGPKEKPLPTGYGFAVYDRHRAARDEGPRVIACSLAAARDHADGEAGRDRRPLAMRINGALAKSSGTSIPRSA